MFPNCSNKLLAFDGSKLAANVLLLTPDPVRIISKSAPTVGFESTNLESYPLDPHNEGVVLSPTFEG